MPSGTVIGSPYRLITNARLSDGGVGTQTTTLAGRPFSCGSWTEDSGASIAAPNVAMDFELPFLGTIDIPQVLRLNDD